MVNKNFKDQKTFDEAPKTVAGASFKMGGIKARANLCLKVSTDSIASLEYLNMTMPEKKGEVLDLVIKKFMSQLIADKKIDQAVLKLAQNMVALKHRE